MNKFNQIIRFKFEVKDLDKEIDVDVNSVSETWESEIEFNMPIKIRTSLELVLKNCFTFKEKNSEPQFSLS